MIPPSYLNFGATDYNTLQCYGSLQSNAGLNLSIYGITFLKSVFVVFDDENKRIGIAPKAVNMPIGPIIDIEGRKWDHIHRGMSP
ncbi:hypothetical protein TSTA_023120 [Talaromyces stipitatus ATCC 10500]|uniref:Peptidase A1 domain-containing protein n=1 Tax=Talaromyces stipitatus (strain ATCC 10500 / CBS 375.48 / QM 6759 / NRRL 1006) TaxID=441959 RepID=B8MEX5_TALSN|nr:uncharacterized protein TSTA_023120 [Talaromyces stipitatus ATCC 10500]EED17258.1 hypothetical protein TSTA_023120 [Talaromyces stipitatus ATCC 10500]